MTTHMCLIIAVSPKHSMPGYTERYEDAGKGDFSVNVFREYFVDGAAVSKTDYNNAVHSFFDFSQSIEFYEKSVSYNEIKQQLL